MKTPFAQRRRALQSQLAAARLSGLLITSPASWYYLTGFTGEAGALVVSRRGAALVTDGRFVAQARQETSGIRIVQQQGRAGGVGGAIPEGRASWRGSGLTRRGSPWASWQCCARAPGGRTRWIATGGQVEALRGRKEAGGTGADAQGRGAGGQSDDQARSRC